MSIAYFPPLQVLADNAVSNLPSGGHMRFLIKNYLLSI